MELALTLLRRSGILLREHFAGPYYLGNGLKKSILFRMAWAGKLYRKYRDLYAGIGRLFQP